MAEFGTACYLTVGEGPHRRRCAGKPKWQTTQSGGANPMNACGRHIGWLLRMRTVPGHSVTVTQLPIAADSGS